MKLFLSKSKGFTLIEIVLVIGILAIITAVAIIAINPVRQFEQARNTTREGHINSIGNAFYIYQIENKGRYPDCVPGYNQVVDVSECEDELVPIFIAQLPEDPSPGERYMIGYENENKTRIKVYSTSLEYLGTRDARRKSDIRHIMWAMEMYYVINEEYPELISESGISDRMALGENPTPDHLALWPKDPGGGNSECNNIAGVNYCVASNASDRSLYCVWAELEGGGFFSASEQGVKNEGCAPCYLSCGTCQDDNWREWLSCSARCAELGLEAKSIGLNATCNDGHYWNRNAAGCLESTGNINTPLTQNFGWRCGPYYQRWAYCRCE